MSDPVDGIMNVLLLGKIPPPYIGPAVATELLLNSRLKEEFHLIHLDTRLGRSVGAIGRWKIGKLFRMKMQYIRLFFICVLKRPTLVWIPISQSTPGFLKDSVYILIARLTGRRVLLHLRGSNLLNWLRQSTTLTRIYVSWIIKRTQGAIVLGEKLRYLFEPFLPADKIFVVPNGADYVYSAVTKKMEKNGLRLLYLSNLQPGKGIQDIIEALKILMDQTTEVVDLQVVGAWRDHHTRKICEEVVRENHLPVEWISPKTGNEKQKLFKNADIFLFTPRAPEGHPWVIVEAMAAGLPIITTDQGAITESVQNGFNGFVVDVQNPGQIAEKILFLMKNRGLIKKMGDESRKLYLEKFTEKRMVDRLVEVIYTVTGDG